MLLKGPTHHSSRHASFPHAMFTRFARSAVLCLQLNCNIVKFWIQWSSIFHNFRLKIQQTKKKDWRSKNDGRLWTFVADKENWMELFHFIASTNFCSQTLNFLILLKLHTQSLNHYYFWINIHVCQAWVSSKLVRYVSLIRMNNLNLYFNYLRVKC